MRSLLATLHSLLITLVAVAILGAVAGIVFGYSLFECCLFLWNKARLQRRQSAIALQLYTNRRT